MSQDIFLVVSETNDTIKVVLSQVGDVTLFGVLADVVITDPQPGQMMIRDPENNYWVNKTPEPSDVGAAAAGHSHTTFAITTRADIPVIDTSIGKYSPGDTIPAGTSLELILNNILQTFVPPVYRQPSLAITMQGRSLTSGIDLIAEVGTEITAIISANFQQNDAGDPTAYTISKDGLVVLSSASPVSHQLDPFVIGSDTVTIDASVAYGDGPILLDNVGEQYPIGQILAGSVSSNMIRCSGFMYLFSVVDTGTSAPTTSSIVRALPNKITNPQNGSTFSIAIPSGTTRVCFAYPASLQDVASVKYVQFGNAEVKDTFTKTLVDVEDAGGSLHSYKVYTYIASVPYGSTATYTVTI